MNAPKKLPLRGKIIWIADDNPGVREVTRRFLEARGATVQTFADPYSAIAAIRGLSVQDKKDHPNVVVTDKGFSDSLPPGGSPFLRQDGEHMEEPNGGRYIAEAVKEIDPKIRVVLFSGAGGAPLPDTTMVEKPDPDKLVRHITQLLQPGRHR